MSRFTIELLNAEISELLKTTCHNKEDIELLKKKFENMLQKSSKHNGQADLSSFLQVLELQENSVFGKYLFERIDTNQDGTLGFFEFIHGVDGFKSKSFKDKIKAYFNLFSTKDHRISKSQIMKLAKDLLGSFKGIHLSEDFFLSMMDRSSEQDFSEINSNDDSPKKGRDRLADSLRLKDAEEEFVSLDEFYDHFLTVFPLL